MIDSVIKPLEPQDKTGWRSLGDVRAKIGSAFPTVSWYHGKHLLAVLSAVEVVVDPKEKIEKGPEYHISISKAGMPGRPARCSAAEAAWVLHQFGLDGWEEDNHVPDGMVRNFWRPVADSLVGIECECKDVENKVVEGDFVTRPLPLR